MTTMADHLTVEIAFGDTSHDTTPVWVAVQSSVLKVDAITSRRSSAFDRFQPGRATIELYDPNRDFDPSYASSPYVNDFKWGTPVRIRCDVAATPTTIWSGWVDSFIPRRQTGKPTTTVNCRDGLQILAEARMPSVDATGAGDQPHTRIGDTLDLVNWPTGARELSIDGNAMSATTRGSTALAEINKAAETAGGVVMHDPNTGDIRFETRHDVYTDTRFDYDATYTFGPTGAMEIIEGSLILSSTSDQYRNVAHVQVGQSTYTFGAPAATEAPRAVVVSPPVAVPSQARGLAAFYHDLFDYQDITPKEWATVVHWGTNTSAPGEDIATMGLHQRARVFWEGGAEQADVLITSIHHRITPDMWTATMTAEPHAPYAALTGADAWMVLGTGLVGTNKLGY